jgi:hypothetical protein
MERLRARSFDCDPDVKIKVSQDAPKNLFDDFTTCRFVTSPLIADAVHTNVLQAW